jgi:tricorn protease-like protein
MYRFGAGLVVLVTVSVGLAAGPSPLLLQHPTLSATQIAFVYAGDLWTVARGGGVAQRLTAGIGTVSQPAFSPDGSEIAFTGDYNGNADVYLIPASGGTPRRLTYHPAPDLVTGWTRDGKRVLFASMRSSYESFNRLFTISREGGFPAELPLPIAAEGSYSPDGSQLAYVPLDHAFEIWKRYRGGRTSAIWIAQLSDSSVESGEYALYIKDQNGLGEAQKIDLGSPGSFFYFPTWSPDGKKIVYTDKRLNLWYVDLEKKTPVRVFHDRFTGPQQIVRAAWSPDSKWLAYTQQELSHMRSVFLYSLEKGESQRVTDGMSDSFSPVFDKSGKYLYFLARTDAGPTMDASMLSYERRVTSSVYITVLRKDLPSPLAPESDEELPRLGPQGHGKEVRGLPAGSGVARRSELHLPRGDGRTHGRAFVCLRW